MDPLTYYASNPAGVPPAAESVPAVYFAPSSVPPAAAPAVIRIGSDTPVIGTLSQTVYTRTRWSDAWDATDYLHCAECTWSLFPTLPTATLTWRYGFLQQIDDPELGIWDRFERTYRLYVKVVWSFQDQTGANKTRNWYGLIELDEDDILGLHAIAGLDGGAENVSGYQTLHAYGLEKLLNDSPIERAYWWDSAGVKSWYTEVLPDFNRRGVANRTKAQVELSAHCFEPQTDPVKAVAAFWSTRDAVNYLLLRVSPIDTSGAHAVPFALGDARGLADLTWDRPVIRQGDRTVFACLNDVVHHGRLLAAWFSVFEDAFGTETVELNSNTLVAADVTIPQPGAPTIPANHRQRPLIFSDDNFTRVVVKRSEIAQCDQIVCRGAPIVCVGSFSITDATLQKGWETSLEVAYAEGNNTADYALLSLSRKRETDREFRAQPKFRDVFAKFIIPPDWDRKVGDGLGGAKVGMFPSDDFFDPDISPQPYYGDTTILHDLPLLMGVDYSGTKIADASFDTTPNTDQKRMPPILVWKQPNTDPQRWKEAARYGDAGDILHIDPDRNDQWSGSISVDGDGHAVRVSITGQQQHVAADNFFSGYAKPSDIPAGKLSSQTMICTLAMHHGRYCEGRYPSNAAVVAAGDLVLRKVFNLGDDYTAIYVAPNTVVGVDKDGTLMRVTTGGWIPKPGPEDNMQRLAAQAKMLHAYYSRQRRVVDVTSAWFCGEDVLQLGDLVTVLESAGHPNYMEVNSFVSSITFRHAQGRGDSRPVPQMHFTTWAGEIDPISPQPWKAQKPAVVGPSAQAYSQGTWEAAQMRAREVARLK